MANNSKRTMLEKFFLEAKTFFLNNYYKCRKQKMQFRQRSILIMDINLENSVSVEIRTSYAVRYTEKKLHTYVLLPSSPVEPGVAGI